MPAPVPEVMAGSTRVRAALSGLLAIVLLAPFAACGSDEPPLVEGVVKPVDVLDNAFRPGEIEVAAGTEVLWENRGRSEHDVVPVEGNAWGVDADHFKPGDVFQYRFTEPGTFAYYCSLHGTTTKGMVGTIVVT